MNPLELIVKIIGSPAGLKAGVDEATNVLKGFKAKIDSALGGLAGGLLQALGGVAIGAAVGNVIKSADEIYTSLDLLTVKVRNFNPELGITSQGIMDFANAVSEGTKFIDDDIIPALDRALVLTGDYGKAQDVTAEAIKLATVANIDLGQAVEYLGLALTGDSRGLMMLTRQLGLSVKEGATLEQTLAKIDTAYQGLGDVFATDLSTQMRKLEDETSGYFEEILKPNLPYLAKAIQLVGDWVKGVVSAFQLLGAYLGTYFGIIVRNVNNLVNLVRSVPEMIKSGNLEPLKLAGQEVVASFKDAGLTMKDAWDKTTEMWQTKTIPALRTLRVEAKLSKKELEEEAAEEEKAWEKYLAGRRRREEQEQKQLNDEFERGLKLIKQEEADLNWETQQKIMADYNKVAAEIDGTVRSAIRGMVDDLFGAKVAWDEWAMNAIKSIVAVIAELLIMRALTGGVGGGFGAWLGAITGNAGGVMGSPALAGVSPAINLTVHNLPPGAWVQAQARMFQDHATPGVKAQLARVVTTGQRVDVKR